MSHFANWTMAKVQAHNARVAKEPPRTDGVTDESELHNEILEECRVRGWIALHGSMAQATGRTLGEFDFTILADGGRVFFIECKTRTGKLSPDQFALHHWARHLGHSAHVVRNMDQFREITK